MFLQLDLFLAKVFSRVLSDNKQQFVLLHRGFFTPKSQSHKRLSPRPFMSRVQLPTGTVLQEQTRKNEVRR